MAWEREIGGTGEGVNKWDSSGREEERSRMWDAPESGIWGDKATRRVVVGVELGAVNMQGLRTASPLHPTPEGSLGCPEGGKCLEGQGEAVVFLVAVLIR